MGFSIYNLPPPPDRIKSFYTTTAGIFNIKNTNGILVRIIVGRKGIGSSILTLYDNIETSGQIIAVIDLVNILSSVEFDIEFKIGLTINITATVGDLTILYI